MKKNGVLVISGAVISAFAFAGCSSGGANLGRTLDGGYNDSYYGSEYGYYDTEYGYDNTLAGTYFDENGNRYTQECPNCSGYGCADCYGTGAYGYGAGGYNNSAYSDGTIDYGYSASEYNNAMYDNYASKEGTEIR